jgi:hypothetical protein
MIANKKKFSVGLGMLAAFIVILIIIFMPIFGGQNALDTLDQLYNSISKGSAYKNVKELKDSIGGFDGNKIDVTLTMHSEEEARQTSLLFQKAAAMVNISGPTLKVSGDLGRILTNCLEDADLMYANKSLAVSGKYGYDARQVLYNWWTAAKEMDKDLKNQKLFKEAKLVAASKKKAIEMAYNYYRIEPSQIGSRYGVVIFSLIFYVVYTLWYGFAIMYLFEGWGLQLEH